MTRGRSGGIFRGKTTRSLSSYTGAAGRPTFTLDREAAHSSSRYSGHGKHIRQNSQARESRSGGDALLGRSRPRPDDGRAGIVIGKRVGDRRGGTTGVQRNTSGSLSGVGPGAAEGGVLRGRPLPPLSGRRSRRPLTAFGPGVDLSYPNDPYLLPFMELEQPGVVFDSKAPTRITNDLIKSARIIASPEERSLALQRIARGAIASRQLFLAHQMLEEATTATSEVTIPLVRDQRLIAIVTSVTELTDATLLQGRQILNESAVLEGEGRIEPLPKGAMDPRILIRTSRLEWKRGVYLAESIGNPTYRNEMMYKVAESMASGSASIANEYVRSTPPGALPSLPPPAPPVTPAATNEAQVPPPDGAAPAPGPAAAGSGAVGGPAAAAAAAPAPGTRRDTTAPKKPMDTEVFRKMADEILVDSFDVAKKVDRLIWRYRAMVRIALLAADSQQYARGFDLARGIQNGESRAEAMLLLAEAQTRDDQDEGATKSYEEAAKAVATVRQDGLRGVLAGFVVDSLIASGRFQDARKCTVLYPNEAQRYVALGAVAESQGRRGVAESARRWIAAEVPEQHRPTLYRRVNMGVLAAIEQNRSKEFVPSAVP